MANLLASIQNLLARESWEASGTHWRKKCIQLGPYQNGNRAHLLGNLKRKYKDHILGDLGKQKSKRAWHMHSMVLRDLAKCKMIMIHWKQENPFLMATVENVAESGGEAPLDI